MKRPISLTLLQRGVIHRLREAGLVELAREAGACWSRGEHAPVSFKTVVGTARDEEVPAMLRHDFDRSNEMADEAADLK